MAPNRYYTSGAVATTLTASLSSVTSGATGSVQVASITGYPTSYPFTLLLDWGTSAQEVVTVTQAATGTGPYTYANCVRGDDGTAAPAHTAPTATVVHGVSARDFTDPQTHLGSSTGVHGVTGALASQLAQTTVQAGNYTATANQIVPVNTTGGNVTVTLPAAPVAGTMVAVKHVIQGGTNTVTVACGGSDVLNKTGGATSLTLSLLGQGVLLQYNTGIWVNLADDLPLTQLDNRYTRRGPSPSGDTTGATDSAALIAAAASAGSWSTIILPGGQYYINQPILCTSLNGVVFKGQGKIYQTRITPVGTGMNGVSVFKFVNCWSCGTENLWVDGNSASGQTPLAGIEAQANNPGGGRGMSTNLIVKDCFIGGAGSNSLTYGIAWTLVSDANNDEGFIENVDIANTASSCVYIGHLNSLQHKFIGGQWYGSSGCSMITLAGGSFSCFGTNFLGPGWVVDFGAGTYTHPSLLSGVQCEGPKQWFRSNAAAAADLYVTVSDLEGGQANTTTIDWGGPGMFSVSSSRLPGGAAGMLAQFTNASSHAVFTGCALGLTAYTWQNTLAFQSCAHTTGAVTLTQLSGASPVYQPNDTGAGFSPNVPPAVAASITAETNRAETAEAALAAGAGVSASLINNAAGGTNGTTVTVANSGGASGNAFTSVSSSGVTFDNGQVSAPSPLSYKLASSASTSYVSWNWPAGVASGATMYLRAFVQFSGTPFNTGMLLDTASRHSVNCNGTHWQALVSGGATVTGTTTPVAGTWYRVETQFIYSATAGATIVRIYNYAGALLETITATGGTYTGAPSLYFGGAQANTTGTMWFANLAVSSLTWNGSAFTTDQTATDIQPIGIQAAGAIGIPADAGHVHPIGSTATASLAFTSPITNGTTAALTMTVTGAATGQAVSLGVPAAFPAGCIAQGFVSAANTVTVVIANLSGASVTPGTISVTAQVH